jgi:hypothetical protein
VPLFAVFELFKNRGLKMSFREFLEKGIKCGTFGDTPARDFAEDFISDKQTDGKVFDSDDYLVSYLFSRGASAEAIHVGRGLFKKWKSKRVKK